MSTTNDPTRREQFRLVLERDDSGRVKTVEVLVSDLNNNERTVLLNGFRVPRIIGPVHQLVRERGVTSRAWDARRPVELDQATGAQLELLLRAVRPLRRLDRLDRVVTGVTSMSREEASYWHVQMTRRPGLRALRLLLGEPH